MTTKKKAGRAAANPGLTIDQWWEQQDQAVTDTLAKMKRSRKRQPRKVDSDEIERRILERLDLIRGVFAENLAVARALYRLESSDDRYYGWNLVAAERPPDFWNKIYQKNHAGRNIDEHCPTTKSPEVIAAFESSIEYIGAEVRAEIIEESAPRKRDAHSRRERGRQ